VLVGAAQHERVSVDGWHERAIDVEHRQRHDARPGSSQQRRDAMLHAGPGAGRGRGHGRNPDGPSGAASTLTDGLSSSSDHSSQFVADSPGRWPVRLGTDGPRIGTVTAVDSTPEGVRLNVKTTLAGELTEGDSVAVNGVCLTATAIADGVFAADVMHESLRRSSLAEIGAGSEVNLELPLRASDRLGGHVVQGHVDGVAVVREAREDGFARVVTFDAPAALLRYVVEKGSIAVDGVSLTVSAVDDDSFSVSLIPETLERTTLGAAEPGRPVNLEVDVLAKYVEKLHG